MNNQQAVPILKALARGIDPMTGEILGSGSPFDNPEVIRALLCAVDALEAELKARQSDNRPVNTGRSWSPEEDQRLLAAFDAGTTPDELAAQHGRTRGGITARLARHDRLEP